MADNYLKLNNLSDASFMAGNEQVLDFTTYDEDGVTLLYAVSLTWYLCRYGEFDTPVLTKTGVAITNNYFTVTLDPDDTIDLSGKYIQQIRVTDSLGNSFITGQGIIIINPSTSQ